MDIKVKVAIHELETGATSSPAARRTPWSAPVHRSPEEWDDLFKSFYATGLSAKEFCKRHDIAERSFFRHKYFYLSRLSGRKTIQLSFGSWAKLKLSADIPLDVLTEIVRLFHAVSDQVTNPPA